MSIVQYFYYFIISDDGHYRAVKTSSENAGYKRGQLLDFSIFHRGNHSPPFFLPRPPFPADEGEWKRRKIQLKLQITRSIVWGSVEERAYALVKVS